MEMKKGYLLKSRVILKNGKPDDHARPFKDEQAAYQWGYIFRDTYEDLRKRGIIRDYKIRVVEDN